MQREGYLLIDHRASPGLPEDIALMTGLDPALVKEGKMFEAGTLTCAHCKTTMVKNLFRTRERYNCPKCSHKYICDYCAADMRAPDYDHKPFEKKVDITKELDARGMLLGTPPKLLMP